MVRKKHALVPRHWLAYSCSGTLLQCGYLSAENLPRADWRLSPRLGDPLGPYGPHLCTWRFVPGARKKEKGNLKLVSESWKVHRAPGPYEKQQGLKSTRRPPAVDRVTDVSDKCGNPALPGQDWMCVRGWGLSTEGHIGEEPSRTARPL
jgi:hypothetical protein